MGNSDMSDSSDCESVGFAAPSALAPLNQEHRVTVDMQYPSSVPADAPSSTVDALVPVVMVPQVYFPCLLITHQNQTCVSQTACPSHSLTCTSTHGHLEVA